MKYYVFRINYSDNFNKIRDELINYHRLRQGWGAVGMRIDQGYDVFKSAWQNQWEKDLPDKVMHARYDNLYIMTEIEPGDYIIIPKLSLDKRYNYVCQSFTVAKCKSKYRFDVLEDVNDFGHIIEVEDCFSCKYDSIHAAQTIKSKFVAYQSPINRVKNSAFQKAVDELVQLHEKDPSKFEKESPDMIVMIGDATKNERLPYLEKIKKSLQQIGDHEFEDLIGQLFEKNGYTLINNNWYDGDGGDIDLEFASFSENSLMGHIYDNSDVYMPHIYLQAKKKTGTDLGDIEGANQLVKMLEKIPEKNAILILVNLTDEFSKRTKELASEYGIILIDGLEFASLFVRFGIDV